MFSVALPEPGCVILGALCAEGRTGEPRGTAGRAPRGRGRAAEGAEGPAGGPGAPAEENAENKWLGFYSRSANDVPALLISWVVIYTSEPWTIPPSRHLLFCSHRHTPCPSLGPCCSAEGTPQQAGSASAPSQSFPSDGSNIALSSISAPNSSFVDPTTWLSSSPTTLDHLVACPSTYNVCTKDPRSLSGRTLPNLRSSCGTRMIHRDTSLAVC